MSVDVEFERTIAGLSRELFMFCFLMAGSTALASDLLDEVRARARTGFARASAREHPRMWLYRIARDVCFERLGGG